MNIGVLLFLGYFLDSSLGVTDEFNDEIGPGEIVSGWHTLSENHFTTSVEHYCSDLEEDVYQETFLLWLPRSSDGKVNRFKCTNRTPQLVKVVMHVIGGGVDEKYLQLQIEYTRASLTESEGYMKITCHIYFTSSPTTVTEASSTTATSPTSMQRTMTEETETKSTTSKPATRSCGCPLDEEK